MWAKIKTWFYKLIGRKSKEDEVFGLEVFDEKGDKTLSITDRTVILLLTETVYVKGASTVTRDYSDFGSKVLVLRVSYRVPYGMSYSEVRTGAKITITGTNRLTDMVLTLGVLK